MTHDGLRFALVALVLTVTVSALAAGMEDSPAELRPVSLQDESGSEGPTLQIKPLSENITENNSTTFLVYLLNPPWNDYPKYVVLRLWSPEYDEFGLRVNGNPPDTSFDQGVGWEFHHDLEPGRQAIYTATVERESRHGNYSIFAAGVFVEDGELTTDTVRANLSIEAISPPPPPLCERIVELIVGTATGIAKLVIRVIRWLINNPVKALTVLLTAIGVFAGLSQLLIALYGRERFLEGIRWPVRQFRKDGQRSGEQEPDNPK